MTDVLAFGEILWDVIDGVPHIGGAPFNFAAHVARFGLKSAVVSAVGNDDLGRRAIAEAKCLGVDVSMVGMHPTLPTGTVNVTLEKGIPSYEIVQPVAWDEITGEVAEPPRTLYFGTLAQRSPISASTLRRLLVACSSSVVFFDVNLRQRYWSKEAIDGCMDKVDILKVNDEELKTLGYSAEALFACYPRLRIVIETRGKKGCAVFSRSEPFFESPAVSFWPAVDTVGAGDSFSAAFVTSILKGGSLREAAEAGNRLAGWVASRPGAIPAGQAPEV
ncbi:MAG: carbohydrate kinase [Kiritimatiellae bacterium]|nr:carbohydrate kinase [Kiritimatiellia bacterium]MBQ7234909.1 carbohydrate kinase [Kiritimatiellia bacterium]